MTAYQRDLRLGQETRVRQFIPVPYEALDCARSPAERLFVLYLYEIGHTRRWMPFGRSLRQMERESGCNETAIRRVIKRLEDEDLLRREVEATGRRKEGTRLRLLNPAPPRKTLTHELTHGLTHERRTGTEEEAEQINRLDARVTHGLTHGAPHPPSSERELRTKNNPPTPRRGDAAGEDNRTLEPLQLAQPDPAPTAPEPVALAPTEAIGSESSPPPSPAPPPARRRSTAPKHPRFDEIAAAWNAVKNDERTNVGGHRRLRPTGGRTEIGVRLNAKLLKHSAEPFLQIFEWILEADERAEFLRNRRETNLLTVIRHFDEYLDLALDWKESQAARKPAYTTLADDNERAKARADLLRRGREVKAARQAALAAKLAARGAK